MTLNKAYFIIEIMMQVFKKNGILILFYSVLVFAGGLTGFILKKSTPSLIMGGIFGLALLWTSVLHFAHRKWGIYLSFILLFMLEGFFSFRFIKTEAFFPSGMMLIVTSFVIILLLLQLAKATKKLKDFL